jgi:hypothetical protein
VAELTNLESKLGEVVGLAMAAQEAGQKVAKLAKEDGNDELVGTLETMLEQAKETEQRGTEVASVFEGKKTAIPRGSARGQGQGAPNDAEVSRLGLGHSRRVRVPDDGGGR